VRHVRRIVHATDFSGASRRAFATALDLAKRDGAELHLLHVLVPPSPFLGDELPPSYLELQASARRGAERRLRAAVEKAGKVGVRARSKLIEGQPAEQIARYVRRARADLIVIGTHGRTGFGRAFMGSVAERVLQRASCPVLTVRGR
jgi:universal stress protein A